MPQTVENHRATVERAVGGDRSAWRLLLDRHGPMVWGICRRLTPDPEDAYQDVWAKVFGALHRFDPDGSASLSTWIATITHRHLVDRHRRRKVRGEVVPLDGLASNTPAADVEVDRTRRIAQLEAAISALPLAQRRIVVMHHLSELPLDDIAAEEGIAVGTVKSRLHRARARLATLLGGRR